METTMNGQETSTRSRSQLVSLGPVTDTRREIAGVSTAVLEAGEGAPVVLLHGQGGFGAMWMPVIGPLSATHRVVVPDLPGLGESTTNETLDAGLVLRWLDELIASVGGGPVVLVGTSLGGSIATRYAAAHGDRLAQLVLVAAGGLVGPVRPEPRVLFRLIRHSIRPSEKTGRAMANVVLHDADAFNQLPTATAFNAYMLELARRPSIKRANRALLKQLGFPQIPSEEIEQIDVPTTLIWGRHDRVMALSDAEEASRRFGWPLHVIEEAAHASFAEQPDRFNAILREVLD